MSTFPAISDPTSLITSISSIPNSTVQTITSLTGTVRPTGVGALESILTSVSHTTGRTISSSVPPSSSDEAPQDPTAQQKAPSGWLNWYFAVLLLGILLGLGSWYVYNLLKRERERKREPDGLGARLRSGRVRLGAMTALERDMRNRYPSGDNQRAEVVQRAGSDGEDLPPYEPKIEGISSTTTDLGTIHEVDGDHSQPPDYDEVNLGNHSESIRRGT